MKLIIDIPEEVKQAFDCAESNDLKGCYYDHGGVIGKAIKNGIPLPEHYGNLKDVDAFMAKVAADRKHCCYIHSWTADDVLNVLKNDYAPTIIPATKEKNSEKVIGTDVCSFTDKVCIGKDCRVCDINKTDHNERR